MKILSVNSPARTAHGINLMVEFEGLGVVPYHAMEGGRAGTYEEELWVKASSGEYGAIAPYIPPAPIIPQVITSRQGKLALLDAGIYQQVVSAIDSMAGDAGVRAKITWESASEFRRDDPVLCSIAAALGLQGEQIDQMFVHGATL